MHSLRARRDLLISAPSIQVCFPFSYTSAPHSDPAKSMNESLPKIFPFGSFIVIANTACDLDESAFAPVVPVVLSFNPYLITVMISSNE